MEHEDEDSLEIKKKYAFIIVHDLWKHQHINSLN